MKKHIKLILLLIILTITIAIVGLVANLNTITKHINKEKISAMQSPATADEPAQAAEPNPAPQSAQAEPTSIATQRSLTDTNIDTSNWDLTKVDIVYDKTGIPVPVPKGYTASSVESEMYVNGLNITKTGTKTDLELSSTGDYPWTQNADNVWVSGNQGVTDSTSTLTSNEFTIGENGGHLTINWTVSCHYQYAYLYATIANVNTGEQIRSSNIENTKYGTAYESIIYTTFNQELSAGTYKLEINYYKNSNTNSSGLDSGYVKSASIINYDQTGTDQVTNHQYGGFVIYKGTDQVNESNLETAQKTRNQWVWVPITDASEIYETDTTGKEKSKLYNYTVTSRSKITNSNYEPGAVSYYDNEKNFARYKVQGMTRQKILQEMQSQFEETIDSISKYGGFWIGRYETGNLSQAIPVVQKMNTDIENQTWYTMYSKLQRIDTSENVKTNMIWGCLWDETLQWLVDTGRLKEDELVVSNSWGNYHDTTFEYTATNGNTLTKTLAANTRIPSGSAEYTNANNIYDMAGNVWDGTLEGNGSNDRRLRGGYYFGGASYKPASDRNGNGLPNGSSQYCGFRAYLYIK